MIAVKNNCVDVVRLLVQEGNANREVADKFGKKAIDRATTKDVIDILRQPALLKTTENTLASQDLSDLKYNEFLFFS